MNCRISRGVDDVLHFPARKYAVANVGDNANAHAHKCEDVGECVRDEEGMGFVGVAIYVMRELNRGFSRVSVMRSANVLVSTGIVLPTSTIDCASY